MKSPIIGIDLGTTNSVVSVCDEYGTTRVLSDDEGNKVQPSVVAFPPNGKVLVGHAAKKRKVIDPQNTVYSVKRIMGRTSQSKEVVGFRKRVPYRITEGANQQPILKTRAGDFAPSDISAIVLDHLRDIAAKQLSTEISESLDRAVITVPANFNEAQRAATATAGAIAGITVVRVLNEPTAAALAYGHRKKLKQTVAVYDFGGGTFDISVLKLDGDTFQVIGTAGDPMLGGDDMDERLVELMRGDFLRRHRLDLRTDPQAMMRLRDVAETVKIELSQTIRSKHSVREVAYGAGGKPLGLDVNISRGQFEEKVKDLVDRTFPVCDEALKLAGMQKSDITDVVLVGGTSRVPMVRAKVAHYFGKEPRTDLNPDEAVGIGAGIQGEALRVILDGAGASVTVPEMPEMEPDTIVPDTYDAGTIDVPTMQQEAPHRNKRTTLGGSQTPPPPLPPPARPGSTMKTTVVEAPPLPPAKPAAPPAPPTRATPPAQAALGRMPLKRAQAPAVVQEVVRKGAISQPDMSARSMTADDTLDAQTRVKAAVPNIFDVTPYSLGIGTVGGYCERLVNRNSQLPVSKERVFTMARDGQKTARIQICQGESRLIGENTIIGDLVLEGLQARARSETKIEVTFSINQSGMLLVRAKDAHTGQERQASVNILGAQSNREIEAATQKLRDLMS